MHKSHLVSVLLMLITCLSLSGCGEGEQVFNKLDRSTVTDAELLTCVDHVTGYIETMYQWETGLSREKAKLPELRNRDGVNVTPMIESMVNTSFPDFDEARESFQPIVAKYWTGNEWKTELGSFGSKLKHDPAKEWPLKVERVSKKAVEVFVLSPNPLFGDKPEVRIYRLDNVADDSSPSDWRISRFFTLMEVKLPNQQFPAPPQSLNDEVRPPIPDEIAEVCDDPVLTTVRLRPHPDLNVATGASHIGGTFLANSKEAWPCCDQHNTAMVAILQLRKSDVPELPFRDDEEVFQLTWCPFDHEDDASYCPAIEIRWLTKSQATETSAPNPETRSGQYGHLPVACRLYPHRMTELPELNWETYEEDSDRIATWLKSSPHYDFGSSRVQEFFGDNLENEEVHMLVGPTRGTKVGGYPNWIQDPEIPTCDCCQAPMAHLLTISTDEWESGPGMIFRSPEFHESIRYNPTGLMLGDVGSIYVFICIHCKERFVKRVFQSS